MIDSKLTVRFEALGVSTDRVGAWQIASNYLTSTDGFSFTLIAPDQAKLHDVELQPVELLVDGNSQLFGRIDRTVITDKAIEVECAGRDFIADMVECNIDPSFQLKEGMQVGQALILAATPAGIFEVQGSDEVRTANIRTGRLVKRGGKKKRVREQKLTDYKPHVGEGIYEFCNRIASRHEVTIQPGEGRGIITLSEPDFKQTPLYEIRVSAQRRAGAFNNVISATASRDYSKFPTFTIANNKTGRVGEKATGGTKFYDMAVAAKKFAEELGRIVGKGIATGRILPTGSAPRLLLYRLLHFEDIEARDDDQLQSAVLRAVAERFKDTLEYRATLQGHADPASGAIWTVDTMVKVTDEIRGIDETLWIAERTLKFDAQQGATTEIVCWRPDSFQIATQ